MNMDESIQVKRSTVFPERKILSEVIVALAIFQMFLSATIPELKVFQVHVELILIFSLFYACLTLEFSRGQILLMFVYVFVTAGSFITNDLATFSVNAKQNGLAVLSFLYFSKIHFESKLILYAVMLSILLMVIHALNQNVLLPFISLTFNVEFNLSRFGGLFLNAHFNAFFLAIALLYYGQLRHLYGFGLCVMYFTASKFIFVSYIANLLSTLSIIRYFKKYRSLFTLALIIFLLAGLYTFVNYSDVLIEFLLDKNKVDSRHNSVIIILSQLADPMYYKYLFNLFPAGQPVTPEDITRPYTFHSGHNEIGFFALASQSGVLFGGLYLIMLIRYARFYTVFILFSLLHNNFILSPLVIYMFITYSRNISYLQSNKNNFLKINS